MPMIKEALIDRAIKAYMRRFPDIVEHERPTPTASKVIEMENGRTRVLVENPHRVLAIFRVRGDGTLRYAP